MSFMDRLADRAILGNTVHELHEEGFSKITIADQEHFTVVHASLGRRRIWIKMNFQNTGAEIYSDWNVGGGAAEDMIGRMTKFAEALGN